MFPPYIKMRDGKGFDTKNWHVYTLIGFTDQAEVDKSTGKFTGKMQYTPIYGLVSKKDTSIGVTLLLNMVEKLNLISIKKMNGITEKL